MGSRSTPTAADQIDALLGRVASSIGTAQKALLEAQRDLERAMRVSAGLSRREREKGYRGELPPIEGE